MFRSTDRHSLRSAIVAIILALLLSSVVKAEETQSAGPVTGEKASKEPPPRRWGLTRERLSFTFGIGSGFSYVDSIAATGLIGPDENAAAYFDLIGLELSNTVTEVNLTAAYQLSRKSYLFARLPVGVVEKRQDICCAPNGSPRRPGSPEYAVALGEVGMGFSREIISESPARPKLEAYLYADSDLARFSSLGDGLWDLSMGLQTRKFFSKAYYGFAEADYTHRFSKGGVKPGEILGTGLGVGSLLRSGVWKLEMAVKSYRLSESSARGHVLLPESTDMVFQASLVKAADGRRVNLNVGQLNEEIDIKSNSIGFDFTMPIWQQD